MHKALALFAGMPLTRHAIDAGAVLALANQYRLSADDAPYLWLAAHLQVPLATFDAKLAAARQHLTGPEGPDRPDQAPNPPSR